MECLDTSTDNNKNMTYFSINIIFTLLCVLIAETEQGESERRLLDHLFKSYEDLERPVINDDDALEVQFGLTLQQIIDVDEKFQVLHSNIWLNLIWIDYRLQWDPLQYGNITVINVPIQQIWRPDVLMYNSADEKFDAAFPTNAVIGHKGVIKWVPPGIFKSTCNIDIRWFPFDDQQCELKFGSWTYDGTKLNLTLMNHEGDISAFIKNGEWTLLGFPAILQVDYYECCPNQPFPSVTYYLKIRRGKLFILTNFVIPTTIITSLSVASFILPVDSGEKVTFGMPGRRNVKFYEPEHDVPWIDVAFYVNIRRRALYYVFNLVIPSVILSVMSLLTFSLPVESGEKISLGVTILLSMTVFLLLVAEAMPPTSDAIPLIGIYFAVTMLMCSLSVIFTVLVLNLHSRRPETCKMPRWVKRGVCQWLAWLLLMKRPGHDLTRHGLILSSGLGHGGDDDCNIPARSSSSRLHKNNNNNNQRSILANVIEVDEDIRVLVNKFRAREFNMITSSAPNNDNFDRGSEIELYETASCRRKNSAQQFNEAKNELSGILEELRTITMRLRDDKKKEDEASDWKFAAMVVDRLCLYIFIICNFASSSVILLSAPNLFA